MLLEVLLAGGHELDSCELVAVMLLVIIPTLLGAPTYPRASKREMMGPTRPRCNPVSTQ